MTIGLSDQRLLLAKPRFRPAEEVSEVDPGAVSVQVVTKVGRPDTLTHVEAWPPIARSAVTRAELVGVDVDQADRAGTGVADLGARRSQRDEVFERGLRAGP